MQPVRIPSGKKVDLTKPLTNPADLFALLTRFVAANILLVATLIYLVQGQRERAVVTGVVSLLFQLWTVSLWRKLRDQRITAKIERAEAVQVLRDAAEKEEEAVGVASSIGHLATARNVPSHDSETETNQP
jgi:hypothetical protein